MTLDKTPAQQVADFHNNSDVDFDRTSQHHTLGKSPLQASPGNHDHPSEFTTGTIQAGFIGICDVYKGCRGVTVVFSITNNSGVSQPGGSVLAVMPVDWHPPSINISLYYFFAIDTATGNPRLMYVNSSGQLVNVFSIPIGAGTTGSTNYQVYP